MWHKLHTQLVHTKHTEPLFNYRTLVCTLLVTRRYRRWARNPCSRLLHKHTDRQRRSELQQQQQWRELNTQWFKELKVVQSTHEETKTDSSCTWTLFFHVSHIQQCSPEDYSVTLWLTSFITVGGVQFKALNDFNVVISLKAKTVLCFYVKNHHNDLKMSRIILLITPCLEWTKKTTLFLPYNMCESFILKIHLYSQIQPH